jgi:uncharacterized iron-regulated protein
MFVVKRLLAGAAFTAALLSCRPLTAAAGPIRLYDLAARRILTGSQALAGLQTARFVVVGELHTNARHHLAQLQVIQALERSGRQVAVGLEMFRSDSQADLDRWVSGSMDPDRFKRVFLDNWGYRWDLYRPIFDYARRRHIPMVGLNVPDDITSQVALHGFESLNKEQRGALEGITCDVTPAYRDFIMQAYGAHSHGQMEFGRFCEAQLVWDAAMAINSITYLQQHPRQVLVILAGSGHARKPGIPAQLEKRTSWPCAVVLPETPGIFDANTLSGRDADFLIISD